MELISEGNLTIMRAVESFDFHRGHRFSTYATLALMKGFARSVPQMLAAAGRSRSATGDDGVLASVADTRFAATSDRLLAREEVGQLLSRLDDQERNVLLAHYGLEGRAEPATYEQVGRLLGMTKQRVRQIEQSALVKLRSVAGVGAG
jgi:RNA polymerase sigma factor (sigma-70 family)